MGNNQMINDLTVGSVAKQLFKFAAPLFFANALQAIYNIVDMVVVGQVMGGVGMSAVAIGGNLLHLLCFLGMGFSSAGQIIIAQNIGAKNYERASRTIGTLMTLLLSAAIAMSVICYAARGWLLDVVNTPAESYDYTMEYTVICIAGLIFIYGYNVVSAIMRGLGDSKRPFMFVFIASILNMILDIVFVVFMDMEVIGAALATVLGQGISFGWALIYLYRKRKDFVFDFKLSSFKVDKQAAVALLKLGIPMSIQSAAISVSMTVVSAWVNTFGYVASAIAGMIAKMNMMAGILSMSISTAGGSMVGQNLGAKKYDRVPLILKNAFLLSLALSLSVAAVVLIFPEQIFAMFTHDEKVLASAAIILGPFVVNCFGAATRTFGFAMINGSGNSKLNLLIALIDGMIARIALAYILGFAAGLGPQGFWYGDAVAGFMPMVIGGIYFLSGRWKKI